MRNDILDLSVVTFVVSIVKTEIVQNVSRKPIIGRRIRNGVAKGKCFSRKLVHQSQILYLGTVGLVDPLVQGLFSCSSAVDIERMSNCKMC